MIELLDVSQIAALLRKTVPSIRSDVSRNPLALPPRCRLPGSRRLLWRVEDVNAWLAGCVDHSPHVIQPVSLLASNEPKRRGRPRKTELSA
jgi:predicted DNA-binding transcriptional regulator AlpA